MKKINLNRGWNFTDGEISNLPIPGKEARLVNLPHDFMISNDVSKNAKGGKDLGFYPECVGTYEKILEFTQDEIMDTMQLSFDGCFGKTKVLVNGNPAGRHVYGYTPFDIDIRPFVKAGKNKITVIVHNDDMPNGRWYSGAGLYRGVDMLLAPAVHIPNNGLYVYTDHITNGDAFLKAEVTICNDLAKVTGDTEVLLQFVCTKKATGETVATRIQKAMIPAGEQKIIPQSMMIESPDLWCPETPVLYEMQVSLAVISSNVVQMSYGNREGLKELCSYMDDHKSTFGIRTISADARNGLLLNGKSTKLKGGCIHHDNGMLGACAYYDAEYRKVKIHKDNGYNALRLAHNPPSSGLLDICDELGMIVIDEAFDVWNRSKNSYDFGNHFKTQWQQEIKAMLLRDRNHPSVVFWSIGNELLEQTGLEHGYETSEILTKYVRKYDNTRLVCGALSSCFQGLNGEDNETFWRVLMEEAASGGGLINMDSSFGKKVWPEYTEPFVKNWDVVGYNYLNYQYESTHTCFPDRVMCSTESMPKDIEPYWEAVERLPYLIGDFIWTSYDYIGEAGIAKRIYTTPESAQQMVRMLNITEYPWRLAGAGDFDICGFAKPQSAYHRVIWGGEETYIFSHNPENTGKVELIGNYGWPEGGNHWTWPAETGNPVVVEVYSRAEEVELLLNGNSLGRQPAGKNNHYKAKFELGYEPGELCAISYVNNEEVSRDQVATAGTPLGIRITMERNDLTADGQSLAYGLVEVVDANGNYVPTAPDILATAEISGNATLEAFGNGRGATEENYTKGRFTSYEGRWQFILRVGYEAGEASIAVKTEVFGNVQATVLIK